MSWPKPASPIRVQAARADNENPSSEQPRRMAEGLPGFDPQRVICCRSLTRLLAAKREVIGGSDVGSNIPTISLLRLASLKTSLLESGIHHSPPLITFLHSENLGRCLQQTMG
jgi:hypothetical protein